VWDVLGIEGAPRLTPTPGRLSDGDFLLQVRPLWAGPGENRTRGNA